MAAFGSPGFGIGPDRFVEYHQFVDWMFPNYPKPAPKLIEFSRTPSFLVPISEAIQLLQNSELVAIFCRLGNSSPDLRHVATRLGMATLAGGNAAVRQRIKDRTGL
jgi:hypothetical protein